MATLVRVHGIDFRYGDDHLWHIHRLNGVRRNRAEGVLEIVNERGLSDIARSLPAEQQAELYDIGWKSPEIGAARLFALAFDGEVLTEPEEPDRFPVDVEIDDNNDPEHLRKLLKSLGVDDEELELG